MVRSGKDARTLPDDALLTRRRAISCATSTGGKGQLAGVALASRDQRSLGAGETGHLQKSEGGNRMPDFNSPKSTS